MGAVATPTAKSRSILTGTQVIVIEPGTLVHVRHTNGESYGAVIVDFDECTATLTFTPPGAPRRIPLGMILCTASSSKGATLDLSSIPEYQPTPNRTPRRSRRRAEADVRRVP